MLCLTLNDSNSCLFDHLKDPWILILAICTSPQGSKVFMTDWVLILDEMKQQIQCSETKITISFKDLFGVFLI